MDLGIKGKRAIVCASSKGLGFGCAQALAQAGVDVVLNGRSEESLEAAAEKLLFGHFNNQTERYKKRLKGETPAERAASLAKVREQEGYLSHCEDDEGGLRIIEHHSPFGEIADKYPSVFRMEEQMFERVLGTSVEREEERASALVRFVFRLG